LICRFRAEIIIYGRVGFMNAVATPDKSLQAESSSNSSFTESSAYSAKIARSPRLNGRDQGVAMKSSVLKCLTPLLIWASVAVAAFGQETANSPMSAKGAIDAPPSQLIPPPPPNPLPATTAFPPAPGLVANSAPSATHVDAGRMSLPEYQYARLARSVSFDADYLLWFLASPRDDAPIATGISNAPLLAGIDPAHSGKGPIAGARLSLGYWQIEENPWIPSGIRDVGAEINYFFIGNRSLQVVDQLSPTIIRPFVDVNNRQASGFIVASPGLATGGVFANAQGELWGGEANLWKNVFFDYPGTQTVVNVMAGFRYLELSQDLNIRSVSVFNNDLGNFPAFQSFAGNTLRVSDTFAAQNQFYGGQLGISSRFYPCHLMRLDFGAKLAVGTTHQEINIIGRQLRTLADGTQVNSSAGLLALPTNIGRHSEERFTQVPEIDFKVTALLAKWLDVSVGFTSIYWSRIMRPGLQIDRGLDITQIPNFPQGAGATPTGLTQPFVPFRQSDLWLLGLSVGVELRW
jgi:hypothetical protein